MDDPTAANWDEAIGLARTLGYDADLRVPKSSEPALPASLSLRRSNFPWSIHKGATAVYRETERGDHLQIREYPRVWTVSRDHYNPHYRPVGHAAVDIPAHLLVAMVTLTPLEGYRWILGDGLPSPTDVVPFSKATLGALPRFGLRLLGGSTGE
jgi:hypothetical protein